VSKKDKHCQCTCSGYDAIPISD